MSEKIVQLNEEIIKGQLKELVRGSVEETLNELLEKEAESLTQAARYERSEARQGYRSGHYDRNLTTTSGDLWMDERRCYWLRPDSIDAQSYLAAIALELDSLGFDEVLFDNFYVPSDSSIAWDTEAITPVAALEDCAENLTANLTGSSIRLALGTSVPSVAQYASRVFVTTERANDVLSVTDAMTEVLPDPATQLVFVTTSHDTRFDASGVIRPLLGDSSGE